MEPGARSKNEAGWRKGRMRACHPGWWLHPGTLQLYCILVIASMVLPASNGLWEPSATLNQLAPFPNPNSSNILNLPLPTCHYNILPSTQAWAFGQGLPPMDCCLSAGDASFHYSDYCLCRHLTSLQGAVAFNFGHTLESVGWCDRVLQRNKIIEYACTHTHTDEELAHMMMEAKCQNLQLASWIPRRAKGIVPVQVQRPENQESWWYQFQTNLVGSTPHKTQCFSPSPKARKD